MSTSNSVNKKIRTTRTKKQINQIINKVEKMTINKKVPQMPEDSAFMKILSQTNGAISRCRDYKGNKRNIQQIAGLV